MVNNEAINIYMNSGRQLYKDIFKMKEVDFLIATFYLV